jgi:hypothetical protein
VQGIWTLAIDESGRFEPGSTGESADREHIVLGGVLCPGDATSLDGRWSATLSKKCRELGISYPPHATELRSQLRDELATVACSELATANGEWVFIADAIGERGNDVVLYARMLGELVDLAARLVARRGGHKLDVRPAQRTVPLLPADATRAAALGLERMDSHEDGRVYVRTTAVAEVRQALESLRREAPGLLPQPPALESVEVIAASRGKAHAAVQFADVGSNRVRAILGRPSARLDDLLAAFPGTALTLVGRDALRRFRAVDRCIRGTPIDVVSAARELYRATSSERATHVAIQESSKVALEWLWKSSLDLLSTKAEPSTSQSIAHALYSGAELHLSSKSGSYEGLWHALDEAWAGDSALASGLRQRLTDRELAARLWRVTLECANHRGDVATAVRAEGAFESIVSQGASLALLAERLLVVNLASVALQNSLPAPLEAHAEITSSLRENIETQVAAADLAGDVLALAISTPAPVPTPSIPPAEQRLWKALGDVPKWAAPDRERGRHYGTAARSLAFLADLDRARNLCIKARLFFSESPFDLRFNAAVLARIELERARISPRRDPQPLLTAALDLAGCSELDDPGACASLVQRTPATRFALDLVLRKLLWTVVEARERDRWTRALEREGPNSLLHALSTPELHTHPTELIGRHAAELLGPGAGASRWLALSVAVSNAAPDGSTIRRFGEFTARVFESPTGPVGCVTNPSFEYR